ncbi:MAG: pyridoxamine 5'-phosphate oxidase family protein [Lachnospiraceae bacterium]|nr:pyridoxamine 5'-phosphate oxidase family protein [Lachnospiraceae bacterium]
MRRKDREKDREFALAVVDKCEYAVLSMCLEDGKPYCVPLSIVRDGNSIYFHSAKEGMKTDAMKKNPNVSLACIGEVHRLKKSFTVAYESAIIFGTAAELTDDAEKIKALRILCERHTPANMQNFGTEIKEALARTAVWEIEMNQITGKCNDTKEKE